MARQRRTLCHAGRGALARHDQRTTEHRHPHRSTEWIDRGAGNDGAPVLHDGTHDHGEISRPVRGRLMFAQHTRVSVKQTKGDIEAVCGKYGADKFGMTIEPGRAVVMFAANNRTLRFVLPLPEGTSLKIEQDTRARWRCLLLAIKAKFETVANKIETFDEAFLAHIVVDDGATAYEKMLPLLPGPKQIERKTGTR